MISDLAMRGDLDSALRFEVGYVIVEESADEGLSPNVTLDNLMKYRLFFLSFGWSNNERTFKDNFFHRDATLLQDKIEDLHLNHSHSLPNRSDSSSFREKSYKAPSFHLLLKIS
jgi:hypothetical protein